MDEENHLIVAHEVTNNGSGRSQLGNISLQAKEVLGAEEQAVAADRGYFNILEIESCYDNGIYATLPASQISSNIKEARYSNRDLCTTKKTMNMNAEQVSDWSFVSAQKKKGWK